MELASGSSEVGSACKQHGQLAGNAFGDSAPVENWREGLRRAMNLTKRKETIFMFVPIWGMLSAHQTWGPLIGVTDLDEKT